MNPYPRNWDIHTIYNTEIDTSRDCYVEYQSNARDTYSTLTLTAEEVLSCSCLALSCLCLVFYCFPCPVLSCLVLAWLVLPLLLLLLLLVLVLVLVLVLFAVPYLVLAILPCLVSLYHFYNKFVIKKKGTGTLLTLKRKKIKAGALPHVSHT